MAETDSDFTQLEEGIKKAIADALERIKRYKQLRKPGDSVAVIHNFGQTIIGQEHTQLKTLCQQISEEFNNDHAELEMEVEHVYVDYIILKLRLKHS